MSSSSSAPFSARKTAIGRAMIVTVLSALFMVGVPALVQGSVSSAPTTSNGPAVVRTGIMPAANTTQVGTPMLNPVYNGCINKVPQALRDHMVHNPPARDELDPAATTLRLTWFNDKVTVYTVMRSNCIQTVVRIVGSGVVRYDLYDQPVAHRCDTAEALEPYHGGFRVICVRRYTP